MDFVDRSFFDGLPRLGLGSGPSLVLCGFPVGDVRVVFGAYEELGVVPHLTFDAVNGCVYRHVPLHRGVGWPSRFPKGLPVGRLVGVVFGVVVGGQSVWLDDAVGRVCALLGVEEKWEGPGLLGRGRFERGSWLVDGGLLSDGGDRWGGDLSRVTLSPGAGLGLVEDDGAPVGLGWEVSDEGVEGLVDEVEVVDGGGGGEAVEVESAAEDELVNEGFDEEFELAVLEGVLSESVGLGEFPGRPVKLGSGGKAVAMLREWAGLGDGRFDDELHEYIDGLLDGWDGVVDGDVWDVLRGLDDVG
jgi:hypothetical protein